MFKDARSFNQPLNNWDVSNVDYMNHMFEDAGSFNQPLDRQPPATCRRARRKAEPIRRPGLSRRTHDWLNVETRTSIEIVALCLGNGGNSKDRDLDRELPFIFTETLGAWAAKEREHVVPRMYRTTPTYSESGSDGEEEDDT